MKITPVEIEKKEFDNSFFGYDKKSVKNFLNQISSDLAVIFKEKKEMENQISELRKVQEDYKTMENNMKATLSTMQELKTSIKENAEKEAERMINEAQLKCNLMITETKKKVSESKDEFNKIVEEKRKVLTKLKLLLQEEYAVVNAFESDENHNNNQVGNAEKK